MTAIVEGKILPPPKDGPDPWDPPIFLLQASPTWAPWLPDGVYQRVPIGSSGQVLTVNSDGSVGWSNSSSGFTNPMTATGDLISSNPGSTPVAVHIGSSGQVLLVSGGLPTWTSPPWLTSPLTTQGDLLVEGASAPGRLAIGSNNQVLTSNGTTATWQNAASGFTNPMTTLGDLIDGGSGGSAQRLGIGSAGQVLTVSGGVPAWATPVTGFANPMTAVGDMITGGLAGAAQRLGVGANGQVLTVVSGSPAWVAGSAGPSAVVFPSGDTTGVTDQANITAAYPAHGGEVLLAAGAFYVKPTSGTIALTVPAQTTAYPGTTIAGNPVSMRGLGPASIIFPVGAGVTGVYYHRTTSYGAQFGQPADPSTGYLRDFTIDGTFTSGAAVGVDVGDGRGFQIDLNVQNFDTSGAVGFNLNKYIFWTEKCWFTCQSYNNSTAVVIGNPNALTDVSQEYNNYDIIMFCNMNQQGVVVQNGVNLGGCEVKIRGNMSLTSSTSGSGIPTNNVAMITFTGTGSQGGSRLYQGRIYTKVEGNPGNGTGNVYPYGVYSDGNGYLREVFGTINHSLNGNGSTLGPGSDLNGAEFGFNGQVNGDPTLLATTTGSGAVMMSNTQAMAIVGNISGTGQVLSVTNTGTTPTNPPMLYTGAAAGDHAFGIQVSGDTNPRWKVDTGGDTLWGSGSAVQDVDLGRNAAGVLLIGGGTANTANVRLGIGGSGKSVLSLAESSSAPSTVTGAGVLYVNASGALHYLSPAGTDTQIGPP